MPAQVLHSNFGALDAAIVSIYLLATVAVGFWVNRRVHGVADFVVAGRSLRSHLSVATMIGSELGLVTVMYAAQKGFTAGFAAFHIGVIAGLAALFVGATGFIVERLRASGVMTIPEYYERRFGRGVRVLGGAILALAGILNMGLFLKAGALFVTGLTGATDPFWINVAMTVLVALVLVYTTLGGMVSVVVTDYVQFIVLSIGMIATTLVAVRALGWSTLAETVEAVHGSAGFDPLAEGTGFGPAYVLWMVFTAGLVSCAIWPTAAMRALSVESPHLVRRLYAWSSVGFAIRFLVPQFLGICALAWFFGGSRHDLFFAADGTLVSDPEQTLQAMPLFLAELLPSGLLGVVAAGMLAAFMSTHDSYLLCWATVLTEDVLGPTVGRRWSQTARLLAVRIAIVAIGVFLLIWSLWYPLGEDLWEYMAVTGAIYFTGAFAVLTFGLYWKRASAAGAYAALAVGTGAVLGLSRVRTGLGIDAWCNEYGIADTEIGLGITLLSVVAMIVGSLALPSRGGA